MSNQYLQGTLVTVGEPNKDHHPRATVEVPENVIRRAKRIPFYEPVAIVPVADLELGADERAAMERLRQWCEFNNPRPKLVEADARIVLSALARLTGGAT